MDWSLTLRFNTGIFWSRLYRFTYFEQLLSGAKDSGLSAPGRLLRNFSSSEKPESWNMDLPGVELEFPIREKMGEENEGQPLRFLVYPS